MPDDIRERVNEAESARWVAGVDGCRGGWVVGLRELYQNEQRARVVKAVTDLLVLPEAPVTICIDVPIGLLPVGRAGGRACEAEARRLLGGRGSSVFSAPSRAALEVWRANGTYAAACTPNAGDQGEGPGLSLQAFGIMRKIAEVDSAMENAGQQLVREVQPELSFAHAGGGPMRNRKKKREGRAERVALLERLGFSAPLHLLGARRPPGAAADDLLDACIACWTAGRVATGTALVAPASPPCDERGLRMQIWR